MKTRHWIILAATGSAFLVGIVFAASQLNRPKQAKLKPAPQAFVSPIVPPKSPENLPPLKISGMIPTTNGNASLMPVATSSTRDPFATATPPTTLQATFQPAPSKPTIAAKSSIGSRPVIPLPQPNIAPQPVALSPLPALPMMPPPVPPAAPTSPIDGIVLTGVIQAGDKLSAIVQDADGTSRYVQVGESLAGGEVTVKKINLNAAGNPSIVLQHNGAELIKTVGQSKGSIAQVF